MLASIRGSLASGSLNNAPVEKGPVVPPPGVSESALLRKIDWHVVPVLCVLYVMAFLDRYGQTSRFCSVGSSIC